MNHWLALIGAKVHVLQLLFPQLAQQRQALRLRVHDFPLPRKDDNQGFFCDGTRRYGIPAPFFQSKGNKLFVMYIINK